MDSSKTLAGGREAFTREAWSDAYALLTEAHRTAPLEADDLDRLATAAFLVGDEATSTDARTRAHQRFLERGDAVRAARSAFWLAFILIDRPAQQAQAAGWLARARRLIEEGVESCAERGFLLCAQGVMSARAGDFAAAAAAFRDAAEIGEQFRERDLIALARHGQGRVLLFTNRTADGFAVLDEVMVSVTCGEVGPLVTGVVYCSVLSACRDVFDIRRAKEWTTALAAWCDAHPDVRPFRGDCLVRRSEMLQLQGEWGEALADAEHACAHADLSSEPRHAGISNYQLAELHRLRGDLHQAEDTYRRASQAGHNPHPGLALLRLAQGQVDAAGSAIRQQLQERRSPPLRAQLLRAAVEVMLAADDIPAARAAADELTQTAARLDASFLRAASASASGNVTLAEGDTAAALALLRDACAMWRDLGAPYECARGRELTGIACRQLGDAEGAQLELEAAAEVFERLGAKVDLARVSSLIAAAPREAAGPLTGREVEVLRLIASGRTNRAIAGELSISEKTVARHVSNILMKLDLPSRSAATAYAYSRKLV